MTSSPAGMRLPPGYGTAVACVGGAFIVLAVLYLIPYLARDLAYPIGGGTPKYLAKARWVSDNGLTMVGTIRTAAPLLMASLIHATGQSAMTLFVIVPPVLAATVGLGSAAMVRAALRVRAVWVPVIAFLTWAAFIDNGIVGLRFDNLVNAALLVPACAVAIVFAGWRRGALAAALLLATGGLAHWPFYGFFVGILMASFAAWIWVPIGVPWIGWPHRLRRSGPMLGAIGASGAVVGLSFLARPATGWLGLRSLDFLGDRLRENLGKVRERAAFFAAPLAVAGLVAAGTRRPDPGRTDARRLFVAMMLVWMGTTAAAVVAQSLGVPTAGARLIQVLFPISILTGVAVWGGARWLSGRGRRGRIAAVSLVLVVTGLFGGLTERWWLGKNSHLEAEGVRQATVAGAYLDREARGRRAVIILDGDLSRGPRSFQVVQAVIPADQNERTFAYYGAPARFLADPPERGIRTLQFGPASGLLGPDHVGILLQHYHPTGYAGMAARFPERIIAPGVLVLRGPIPASPVAAGSPVAADVRPGNLLLATLAVASILLVTGGGYAWALLPPDPVVRVSLAPALGAAVMILTALGWGVAGLPFGGRALVAPTALAAAIGWMSGWMLHRQRGEATPA